MYLSQYIMHTFQPPFASIDEILHKNLDASFLSSGSFSSQHSKHIERLVGLLLHKQPDKRPTIDDLMQDSWFHGLTLTSPTGMSEECLVSNGTFSKLFLERSNLSISRIISLSILVSGLGNLVIS